jgi:hypothetical protein
MALRSVLLIGGTATDRQIDKLKNKRHLVIGSPGRIGELLARGKLKAKHLRVGALSAAWATTAQAASKALIRFISIRHRRLVLIYGVARDARAILLPLEFQSVPRNTGLMQ